MKTLAALGKTTIAAAALAAMGSAHAQYVQPLAPSGTNLDASALSLGIGFPSADGARFGEYNGINQKGPYGTIDFNLVKRDDESGTWTQLFGRNLGLDNRQFRFDQSRQGDWGYYVDYARLSRFDPYTITTAVSGIGTANLTVPTTPTTGGQIDLKTTRDRWGFGFDKYFYGNWDTQLSFRTEEKQGAQIFGRGTTGTTGGISNFEFTPQPIDATTHIFEAKLNYTTSQLQMTGGYFGTMYINNQSNGLNVAGGNASLASFTPIALPPDNQSQQIYLTGGYNFSQSTRGNFKLSYQRATQDDSFISPVTPPPAAGVGGSLMGRVDTTLAQAGVVSNVTSKLTLRGDFRYENRDDKTPMVNFLTAPPLTSNGQNEPASVRTTSAKLEASYALPDRYRLTGGVNYLDKGYNVSDVRITSERDHIYETTYRVELRRLMSETLTGALSFAHSDRTGSSWQTTVNNDGTLGSNIIAPIYLSDRSRDALRFTANWMPLDPLTLNFFIEGAQDKYGPRDSSNPIGPQSGNAVNYSLDAAYALSDKWQTSAWYTRYNTKAINTTCENASSTGVCPASGADPIWQATLKNLSDNIGLGLQGKPSEKIQVGADFSYSKIRDSFDQQALAGNPISSLPDTHTRLTRLNVFGKYALDKKSGVRVDYIYDQYKTDDWTWSSFMFADGTTISQNPNQKVNFFAVSYYVKM